MNRICAWLVVSLIGLPAEASEEPVMMANPSGVPAPSPGTVPPPHGFDPENVICGDLLYDGVNGLAAQRWDSIGLQSWILVHCESSDEVEIQGFNWVTVDNQDSNWLGTADFAIWDADTVENGCADDSNTLFQQRDLVNTREGPIDFLFGRNAWKYHVSLPDRPVLAPGKYYFAVRIVAEGQSFILTVPCNGRKQAYFQSVFFGFPCALPGWWPYCAGIEVLGEPPFRCADDGCGTFKKLACTGPPRFRVVAKGNGTPGGEITVNLDGEDTCVTVDSRGKWKLVWLNAPGSHTATACGSTRMCSH